MNLDFYQKMVGDINTISQNDDYFVIYTIL